MPDEVSSMRITLLGTGTSTGIPVIGCLCRVCTSEDQRDRRSRCACYVQVGELGLVIDTGPDFRQQMLRERIARIDAVLYTHHHYDHISGIDDLRPYFFENRTAMPCYALPATARVLRRMFAYIFEPDGTYVAVPPLNLREVSGAFTVESRYKTGRPITVVPLPLVHGNMSVVGYRIGGFAYVTDTSFIPEETFAQLKGVDILVLDALRHEPHPTHFNIEQAVSAARRIGARRTYLLHITHSILHAEEDARLPEGIALGYDGLSFDAPYSP